MASETPLTDDNKLFENLDGEQRITEIESYCVNCGDNGTTRLLLTVIPHFREVVLMAFECPHCFFRNNEIQSATSLAEKGIHQVLQVDGKIDMSRQIVKSEYATVRFEELDFEIPAQKGVLTTVEGLLQCAIEGLEQNQEIRKISDPDTYSKILAVITTMNTYIGFTAGFTMTLDDPSGNSYIENPEAPKPDAHLQTTHYKRTREQIEAMGYNYEEEVDELPLNEQVHIFPGNCSNCHVPSDTKMHMLGKKITLLVTDIEDLSRDILKSETCNLSIPEIDLELGTGTLGGRFTTVEGILVQVLNDLKGRTGFGSGDSAAKDTKMRFQGFLEKLQKVIDMEYGPVTLILDDPMANSHLQNPYAPDNDPNMTVETYERTWDQNEAYGINDMKVEGYETTTEGEKEAEEVTESIPTKEAE
ncbi:hypothetical protein BSLG_004731 [Batrachochytrium salamandrivorans]|nr:hypothetical protein BSLG_004731 [Batrachochytrium salamandrivorans]